MLPKQECTLVFGEHPNPILSAAAAAAFFAKLLEEENIGAEDITFENIKSACFFTGFSGQCWIYINFYVTFAMEPEYGYMNSDTCQNCRSDTSNCVTLEVDKD